MGWWKKTKKWVNDNVVEPVVEAVEEAVEEVEEAVEDAVERVEDTARSIWNTVSNLTWERAVGILIAATVLGIALPIVGPGILHTNWWEADVEGMEIPIHGEYCGPGQGQLNCTSGECVPTTEPQDPVDAVCLAHDICIVETNDWCVCNEILLEDMPIAAHQVLTDDNPSNDEAAVKADAIEKYFTLQNQYNCIDEADELEFDDFIDIGRRIPDDLGNLVPGLP